MNPDEFNCVLLETIQKRQSALALRSAYKNLLLRILGCFLFCWFFFTHIFLLTQVSGNNMFPALKDGDLILLFRLQQQYTKGDVILYTIDGTSYIGRLIANEQDVISLNDAAVLLVNGTPLQDNNIYPAYAKETLQYPYTIPSHHIFVVGDFGAQSIDSRDFGAIPQENIKGKVITLLRRRGL